MRIGQGYDVHKLVKDRPLILGGVEIEYEKGLLGHSDADVLVHAIMDAILGSQGLRDIGDIFPESDESFKDADSLGLLEVVTTLLTLKGCRIINVDSTVICESPKIAPYIDEMREKISKVLKISSDNVNVKATTQEGLGFTGRGEGIAAMAVCLTDKT